MDRARPAHAAESPSQHPTAPAARGAFVAWAVVALAWLLAGLVADPRTWGVHALAFLPRAAWVATALVLAACVHPRIARAAGQGLVGTATRIVDSPRLCVGVTVAAAALFWALRLRFQFLGDGIVWLERIQTRDAFHHFEPLATFTVRSVAQAIPGWKPATQLASVASGIVFWLASAFACRRAFRSDAATRGLVWLLLVVHPVALLFCGYIESYPLLVAAQAVVTGLWLHGGRRARWASVPATGVAIALHVQAIAWLPALAVATACTTRGASRRFVVGGTAAVIALGCGLALASAVGDTPARLASALAGEAGLGAWSPAAALSARRGLDLANETLLLFGAVLGLAAGATAAVRRSGMRWMASTVWAPVVVLALGALAVWTVTPRIGAARDWDLYVGAVLPVTLLVGEAWRRVAGGAAARTAARTAEAIAGRAAVLACVTTAAWLASQVDDRRAAERMICLQSERGTFSNFARGYANEALGMYYRARNPQAARDAYARAVEANPKNARYWNNLAMHELLRRDQEAARRAWHEALALGMHEWYVYYNLGMVALETDHIDEGERFGEEMVHRWPKRWHSWLCRGQARLVRGRVQEAIDDLGRARALQPDQPEVAYALGLALARAERTAEARRAFAAVLRLAPDHTDARRELERLDAMPRQPQPAQR